MRINIKINRELADPMMHGYIVGSGYETMSYKYALNIIDLSVIVLFVVTKFAAGL